MYIASRFFRTSNVALALLFFILIKLVPCGYAQNNRPRVGWVADAGIQAIACTSTTMFAGGYFSYIGRYTGGWASVSASTGLNVGNAPTVDGVVFASAPDGAGGFYIGGLFTMAGDFYRQNLAHIYADGEVDASWAPAANSIVYALAADQSTVYLGGEFTAVNGQTRNHIAAVCRSGVLNDWNPNADKAIRALALNGNTIYAGGAFATIGGLIRASLAELNCAAPGNATAFNGGGGGTVYALVCSSTTLYVGGSFSSCGGASRANIAAIHLGSSTALANWNPVADGLVRCLYLKGNRLYFGGDFAAVAGTARPTIAAVAADTGNLLPFELATTFYRCYSLAADENMLYAGCSTGSFLGAYDLQTGARSTWDPHPNTPAYTLSCAGGIVYAGGDFTAAAMQPRGLLAAVDLNTSELTPWSPDPAGPTPNTGYYHVTSLAIDSGRLYVAGAFTAVGGAQRKGLAAFSAAAPGAPLPWQANALEVAYCMAATSSTLFLPVDASDAALQTRHTISAIDTQTGLLQPLNLSADHSTIYGLAATSKTLFIGGPIQQFSMGPNQLLSAVNLQGSGSFTALNPTFYRPGGGAEIDALLLHDNHLYAGGIFEAIDGHAHHGLGQFDPVSQTLTAWNCELSTNTWIMAMAPYEGKLALAGQITRSAAVGPLGLLDTTTGALSPWSPAFSGVGHYIALSNDRIYAGGGFKLNGTSRYSVFEFDPLNTRLICNAPRPLESTQFDVTVAFNAPVADFTAADAVINNGRLVNFSGSGTTYTLTLEPVARGIVTLSIPANTVHDAAGHGNTASATLQREATLQRNTARDWDKY